jgi:hypothetical protein
MLFISARMVFIWSTLPLHACLRVAMEALSPRISDTSGRRCSSHSAPICISFLAVAV